MERYVPVLPLMAHSLTLKGLLNHSVGVSMNPSSTTHFAASGSLVSLASPPGEPSGAMTRPARCAALAFRLFPIGTPDGRCGQRAMVGMILLGRNGLFEKPLNPDQVLAFGLRAEGEGMA